MGSSFAVPAPNPPEPSPLVTVSMAMSCAALSSSLVVAVHSKGQRPRVTRVLLRAIQKHSGVVVYRLRGRMHQLFYVSW